jgi:hypothetical protein
VSQTDPFYEARVLEMQPGAQDYAAVAKSRLAARLSVQGQT